METGFAASTVCDTCGASGLEPWIQRSDGLVVLQCRECGTGVVERLPPDLDELYAGDYYGMQDGSERGYDDYAYTAEHSVGWVAPLVELILPTRSRALDVGCADGLLLTRLSASFTRRAGIEVNPSMVEVCRQRGLEILATDVYDTAALAPEQGAFDLVTAMAVFEHVPRFREAVEAALGALAHEGLLLFEVPLLVEAGNEGPDNLAWLTSSLEHLFYPTERSLRHLFDAVLKVPLAGGELYIPGYGSTFVGMASRSQEVAVAASELWTRLRSASAADLTADERRVRAHLHVLHAARSSSDDVACVADLRTGDVNRAVLRRLGEVWSLDIERRDYASSSADELRAHLVGVEAHVSALEAARDQQQQTAAALEKRLAEAQTAVGLLRERLAADQRRFDERLAEVEARRQPQAEVADDLYRQLQELQSSTSWRAAAPIRAVGTARRRMAPLLPYVNARRVRAAAKLAVRGDLATMRQRVEATSAVANAAQGDAHPLRQVVRRTVERWPLDRPLVSVVIPCFNYGAYVDEAIESVLRQTLGDRVELIVVDGGSTDPATQRRLQELADSPPPRTRVLLRQDGRHLVGDNRNFGISRARGKYVCCLDADDVLEPVYLELAVFLAERYGYGLVSTATRCFGTVNDTFGLLPEPDLQDMLLANNVTTVAVFERSLWERSGGYRDTGLGAEHVHEDWQLWLRLAALGARIHNIVGTELFRYRVHSSESLSNHAGVREISWQREAVRQANADVVTPEAVKRSAEDRDLEVIVEGALENLLPAKIDARPGLLLCMPFMLLGGAERLLSGLVASLTRDGFRVVIVTTLPAEPAFGDSTPWFASSTAEIFHLPRLLESRRWGDFLHHLVESKGLDLLLLAGSAYTYGLLPELKERHPHLRVADLLFNTVGHTESNRRYAESIDLHLCENGEVERWLREAGEPAEKVVQIDSGVDIRGLHPVDRPARDHLLIGYSGRLSEEKDPLAFIELAEAARDPRLRFVMTGAGPLEGAVRKRIARSKGAVEFLGVVDDVYSHMAGLDVLVVPSRLDGRPLAVLEALALGVPVLATRVGGLPELVIDDVTGFTCAPGAATTLTSRLRDMLDDPDRLLELKRSARQFAEDRLDQSLMHARYEEALRALLNA